MPYVVTCTFREPAKTYYLDPGKLEIHADSFVVAETSRGVELGRVKFRPREVNAQAIAGPVRRVMRLATKEDLQLEEENRALEVQALEIARERIHHFKLEMKPIKVEVLHDRAKLFLFYESAERVDFRDLLRDLSGRLEMRMHFQQVGPRDAAKVLGGCGPCGKELCCASFLTGMPPVTLKMAKEQGMSLTPSKISGACGRLMCCLRYEVEFYRDQSARLPSAGDPVDSPQGPGEVLDVNMISESCTIRLGDGRVIHVPAEELRKLRTERGPVRSCNNHIDNGGSCTKSARFTRKQHERHQTETQDSARQNQ
jgi:cell fate regulator YaaT (PSP1 superfamily)